mmetsp:Transcript_123456/g.345658  ORF Transcript_123456/g.345658 Transcript_123456/m.345658 type:complete len:543 (-) Transcript_123456:400-2028(-)
MQLHVEDAGALSDGDGGLQVVPCDHPDVDARLVALGDRGRNLGAKGILDAQDAQQGEAGLASVRRGPVAVERGGVQCVGSEHVDVPVRDADGAHGVVRELADGRVHDVLRLDLAEVPDVPGLVEARAAAQDDLAGALCVHAVAAAGPPHRPRHHLSRGGEDLGAALVEGVGRPPRRLVPDDLVVEAHLLGHLEQRALRRVPLEHGNAAPLLVVDAGLVHGAHGAEVRDQLLDPSRHAAVVVHRLAHGAARRNLDVDAGDVRASDRHPVRRQCPRLVRADGRRRSHRLARVQRLHQVVFLRHLVGRQRESDDEGERQTLGDGAGEDAQGHQEDVQQLGGIFFVDAEAPDAHGDEGHRRASNAHRADCVRHRMKLAVQRGRLRLALAVHALLNFAGDAVVAHSDHQHRATARVHGGAGDHEGVLLVLRDRLGLPGQGALVRLHVLAAEENAVARDDRGHVRVEGHDVAHADVLVGDLHLLPVPDDEALVRRSQALRQRLEHALPLPIEERGNIHDDADRHVQHTRLCNGLRSLVLVLPPDGLDH